MIKSKLESNRLIESLGLNRVPKIVVTSDKLSEMLSFMVKFKGYNFSIRFFTPSIPTYYNQSRNAVLDLVRSLPKNTPLQISPSLTELDTYHLLLQGNISIDRGWCMLADLSSVSGLSNRQATDNPEHSLMVDLEYTHPPRISGLNKVIDYYCKHNLFGLTMEFTLYDCPTGINNEYIIIWEIRNY